MPEGSVILLMFCLTITAHAGVVLYSVLLALKYRHVKRDMRCIYHGVVYDIMEIIYDRDDWFKRSIRLRHEEYPYYIIVLISDTDTVTK